jgi:hypothetical protein
MPHVISQTCCYFRASPRFKDTLAPVSDWSSYCRMIAFTCLIYNCGTDNAHRNSSRKLFPKGMFCSKQNRH